MTSRRIAELRRRWKHMGRVLFRAFGDSVLWVHRQYRLEVPVIAASAVVGAMLSNADNQSPWEIIGFAVASGVLTFLLIWFCSFVYFLMRAPRMLRLRRVRQLAERQISLLATMQGPRQSVLVHDALALRKRLWEFGERKARRQAVGGPGNEAAVAEDHKETLRAVERFAEQVMATRPEEASRRERGAALRLYEQLRGFPLTTEIDLLLGLIDDFVRPRSSWKYRFRTWIRGKWDQVT